MIGYVLLSYGAKPTGDWRDHPAARAQIANLKAFANENEVELQQIWKDYCRNIDGLNSLPVLAGR